MALPAINFATGKVGKNKGALTMANPWDPYVATVMGGIQTPQQMLGTARTQAIADEQAALAKMKAASDQIISQYRNQANRAQGFARALGELQAGQDEDMFSRYTQAANTIGGLGAGLSGATAGAYQEAVDRAKSTIGQLTGGLGEITAPSAGDIRNASQYVGADLPASSLAADAVNAANLAASDARARRFGIGQIGRGYDAQAEQAIAQAASDARALIGQRPATIQGLLRQLETNRQSGVQTLVSVLGQRTAYEQAEQKRLDDLAQRQVENRRAARQLDITERGLQGTLRNQAASILGYDPQTGQATFSREQWSALTDQQRRSWATQMSQLMGYVIDPATGAAKIVDGHVVPIGGFKLDKNNPMGVVRTYAPGSTTAQVPGTGGMSSSQWSGLQKDAQQVVQSMLKGKEAEYQWVPPQFDDNGEIRPATNVWQPIKGTGTPGANYPELVQALLDLNDSPRWQKRAIQIANSHFAPGQGGRAWGRGPEAKQRIAAAVKAAKRERVNYGQVLSDLTGLGLPRDLVEKELGRQFGKVRDWGPPEGLTDAGERGGGVQLGAERWDPATDPRAQPIGNYLVRTKSGRIANYKTGMYVDMAGE